jgi:hypothetical protein
MADAGAAPTVDYVSGNKSCPELLKDKLPRLLVEVARYLSCGASGNRKEAVSVTKPVDNPAQLIGRT